MYRRTTCAVALCLIGVGSARGQGVSASLSDLVARADRVVVAEVGPMRNVAESQVVHVRDGQPIMGHFIFTYVDLIPTQHLIGDPVGKVTVRLLGGVHPDGAKFTTYAEAPSISSAARLIRSLPNSSLKIDPREGVGADPLTLDQMKGLIRAERAKR